MGTEAPCDQDHIHNFRPMRPRVGTWRTYKVCRYSSFVRRLSTAVTIFNATRSGVRFTACSQNWRTIQPSVRNARLTRLSRARLASILFRQNKTLVRGRYLHLVQPCQKHPSTKTAILRPGHAKSGLPCTLQCFRYPRNPIAQRRLASGSSVVVLPRDLTAAMILDRTSLDTWSMSEANPRFSD